MPETVLPLRMPAGLPYPLSPDYRCGTYGAWTLKHKGHTTSETGYFTGTETEPLGHYLENNGDIWMSTSRLERESHAIHLKHARGTVVVCGVGMGMYLYNIAREERVTRIIAVDRDPSVIELVQNATGFSSWNGADKIEFIQKDALHLSSTDIGTADIDYLYVDIWPELGNPDALAQTRMIQMAINAQKVGWWGQEIDFIDWLSDHRPSGHVAALADLTDFIAASGLPMEEHSLEYLIGCQQASIVFGKYRAKLRMPHIL